MPKGKEETKNKMKTNEKKDDYDLFCDKLYILSLVYMSCYEELLANRTLLDKCLDDAYLNMSKARSLVGCSNLSILQIPVDELTAKYDINVSKNQISEPIEIGNNKGANDHRLEIDTLDFNLSVRHEPPVKEKEENDKKGNQDDDNDDDFEKVKTSDVEDNEEGEETNCERNKKDASKLNKLYDLNKMPSWFGVLTPLSLKTSHKAFCRSLNIITAICEQQTRLKRTRSRV